jgi:hypothetical protein
MACAENARCPYWTALTALEWARLLTKQGRGDDHRIHELLNAALATAQAHGFARLQQETQIGLEQATRRLT